MEIAKVKTKAVRIKKESSIKKGKLFERILTYGLLVSLSIVFILPFLWLVGTSLKPENEAISFPPSLLPKVWDFANYIDVFTIVDFGQYYLNSIIVTVATVIGTVLSSTLVAYGFARIKGKGRDVWFILLLATMMLPPQVTMIPVYMIFAKLGWTNTFLPLIVPAFFLVTLTLFSCFDSFLKPSQKSLKNQLIWMGAALWESSGGLSFRYPLRQSLLLPC